MADVCDKGVGAAMYMAIFRSLLRAYSDQQYIIRWAGVPGGRQEESQTGIFRRDAILASGAPSLQNAIDLTNNYIATQHGDSNMFATIFFGLLDPTDGTLLYINAGHEAPLVISNGCVVSRLDPTGPAVGMFPNMRFQIERIQLNLGESLVLFTDGVTDALSPDQTQFAEDGLIRAATSPAHSAHARLQNILKAIDQHIAQREQFDDVTLLAVHRKA
jgi:sigma-B regulation protein RsbU (phosphoserine phosphatase)